jgi:hypothetical protein
MPQVLEQAAYHPRNEIHNRVYAGTHAAKLVLAHDAGTQDYVNELTDEPPGPDPGDHIYFLKRGELEQYDGDDLYSVAPNFIKRAAGLENPITWPGEDFMKWLGSEATDAQIVNVFQSALYNLQKTAITPEVEQLIERQMAEYSAGIQQGEDAGWLAAGSADRVAGYRDNPSTWLWGTAQASGRSQTAAAWSVGQMSYKYRHTHTPQVVFPATRKRWYSEFEALSGTMEESIRSSGFHEFNHAFLGGFDEKWLNEAVTEHIAQVVKGNVDIDGNGYDTVDCSYKREIRLLMAVVAKSQRDSIDPITMAQITHAYSSLDPQEVSRMSERFKATTGFNFEELDKRLASRISPYFRTENVDVFDPRYIETVEKFINSIAA